MAEETKEKLKEKAEKNERPEEPKPEKPEKVETVKEREKPKEKTERAEKAEKKQKPITEVLFHVKPAKLLVLLLQDKQWHISGLARETEQSYVYATKTVQFFEKAGLVTNSTKEKRRVIVLTERGEKIAKALNEAMQNAPAGI